MLVILGIPHDEHEVTQVNEVVILIKLELDEVEVLQEVILLLGGDQQQVELVFIDKEKMGKLLVILVDIQHFDMVEDEVQVVMIDLLENLLMFVDRGLVKLI